MSKPNLKSQAKRKRELAKLGKRQAKDEKRALRKAERGDPVAVVAPAVAAPARAPLPVAAALARMPVVEPPRAPLTLAEAAQRWKNSRIVKPRAR